MIDEISKKIKDKTAVYAVVGLGYTGLPLAVAACEAGFKVYGYDVSDEKAERLLNGQSYVEDVSDEEVQKYVSSKQFIPSNSESVLKKADIVSICVPTPLSKTREPDMSYVESAVKTLKKYARPGQIIILESTTYPGTTREIVAKTIENNDLKIGKDIFVAFSPERVDPGNKKYNIKNTPKVVGGMTENCTALSSLFYRHFVDSVHEVSSPEVAEMTKLLENIFRAVNIALVNELMLLSDRMEVNVWEVIEAASTKPFGFMKFVPGPGLGGHCIPIDPFYLSWRAKQYDFWTEFIELAGRISENVPYFVVEKTFRALNSVGKCLSGSKVLLLGLAYKRDVGDVRHSPAEKISKLLLKEGVNLRAHDPYVVDNYFNKFGVKKVDLNEKEIKGADIVILLTDHSDYDWQWIADNASLILDTRNAFKDITGIRRNKIWLI